MEQLKDSFISFGLCISCILLMLCRSKKCEESSSRNLCYVQCSSRARREMERFNGAEGIKFESGWISMMYFTPFSPPSSTLKILVLSMHEMKKNKIHRINRLQCCLLRKVKTIETYKVCVGFSPWKATLDEDENNVQGKVYGIFYIVNFQPKLKLFGRRTNIFWFSSFARRLNKEIT